jgi:hypothetical protein
MASHARQALDVRLRDLDEIVAARDVICPAGAGKPSHQRGSALLRGGTVLLAAAFEGFVEELYELAVDHIYATLTADERKALIDHTSKRLNNADVHKINLLYFNLGIPWIMSSPSIRWQKCSNQTVRNKVNRLIQTRGSIAHGRSSPWVRKAVLRNWRDVITRLADRLDVVVVDYIELRTGLRPW